MKEPGKSQKEAICHLSGPAMVIAGPGSGKTFTLTRRILFLTDVCRISAESILVITYTRAAAAEMKERYEKACGCPDQVQFGTFHSICYQILKRAGVVTADSLIREKDKRTLLQVILSNKGLASKCSQDAISALQNEISRIKNQVRKKGLLKEPDALFSTEEITLIQREYDRHLREQGKIDFDDMITECFRLLTSCPNTLSRYQEAFQYILVDEFQDINPLQYEILKLLSLPANNLFVVGDDDQAIYGFRGASPGIMKQFTQDYPQARLIWMTDNYRSGKAIVTLSEKLISRNEKRFSKAFQPVKEGGRITSFCFDSRREEELQMIRELSSLSFDQLFSSAIITRTNREAIQYTYILKNSGIPVKGTQIRKDDLYHGFIMQDLSAFLAFLYEGKKRSHFIQFMNRPNHFLTRAALPFETIEQKHLEQYYRNNPDMLVQIQLLFRQILIAEKLPPHLAASFFRKTWGYDRYLKERSRDLNEFRMLTEQAERIQQSFKDYIVGTSLGEFADRKAEEDRKNSLPGEEVPGVSVLTMHGSKGLEFDRVFLPDVNEGIIPAKDCRQPESLEEERRLLYVAITRAREHLYLYYTRERGRKLSRYLEGLL